MKAGQFYSLNRIWLLYSYFYKAGAVTTVVLVISDADLERLLDQWEEDDEPLPPDELPEGHPDRPQPQMDLRY